LRERLRLEYQLLDVTGDAVPQDAIGRLIELRMGRHARAVRLIDIMLAAMLARPRMIDVHEQQNENDSDLTAASVPGHPAAGAVAHAQMDVANDNDVIDGNENNSVLQIQRDFAQGVDPVALVQPDNDGNSGSGSGPLPADNDEECSSYGIAPSSVEEGATAVSACDESKGSNEKKRKAV
jgi:hypothetical protein